MGFSFTIHPKVVPASSIKQNIGRAWLRTSAGQSHRNSRIGNKTDPLRSTTQSQKQDGPPSTDECKIHLKLLKVFAHLREDIRESSQTCLLDTDPVEGVSDNSTNRIDRKWEIYTQRAAYRFEIWWQSLAAHRDHRSPDVSPIKCSTRLLPGRLEAVIQEAKPMTWSAEHMPPVDVLMILHSYMLNPRCFLEDCIKFGMLTLWKSGLPWHLVDRCIGMPLYEYDVPAAARQNWETMTSCKWDNLEDALTTNTSRSGAELGAKLVNAINRLRQDNVPLQGTVLQNNGEAASALVENTLHHDPFQVNLLLCTELGDRLSELASDLGRQDMTSDNAVTDSIQAVITEWLQEHRGTKISLMQQPFPNTEVRQICIPSEISNRIISSTKPFAAAHSQSSMFSLDLAAAAIRQCRFIDSMQQAAWVYSPAIDLTLSKLLEKYSTFIQIIGRYPDQVATPTHAVDLGWHTHQLCPASYYKYSLAVTGTESCNKNLVFIDHDDKLSDTVLAGTFEWTRQAFAAVTGKDNYSECLCWHCTATETMSLQRQTVTAAAAAEGRGNNSADPTTKVLEQIARSQHQKLQDDYNREAKRKRRRRKSRVQRKLNDDNDNGILSELDKNENKTTTDSQTQMQMQVQQDEGEEDEDEEEDRRIYLQNYKWLYPNAIPVIENHGNHTTSTSCLVGEEEEEEEEEEEGEKDHDYDEVNKKEPTQTKISSPSKSNTLLQRIRRRILLFDR